MKDLENTTPQLAQKLFLLLGQTRNPDLASVQNCTDICYEYY